MTLNSQIISINDFKKTVNVNYKKGPLIENTNLLYIKNSAVNISKINLAFLSFSKYCILLCKRAFLLRYNAEDDYILLKNPSAVFYTARKKLTNCDNVYSLNYLIIIMYA